MIARCCKAVAGFVPASLLLAGFVVAGILCTSAVAGETKALLVACSRYPHLQDRDLPGVRNDVALFRTVLQWKFGLKNPQIVELSDRQRRPPLLPTRANIVREMRRLVSNAESGQQILIYFAGHGCQQPDNDPENEQDPEPDHLDEVFLPRDVDGWDGGGETIGNAIVDDELRTWFNAILAKGASIWFIADACHSGTMNRGGEMQRQAPIAELVPAHVLQQLKKRPPGRDAETAGAEYRRGGVPGAGALAAIFASQSDEPAIERPMPPNGDTPIRHGLLTYAICQALSQTTRPLTYRQLHQAVLWKYPEWGRSVYPTPSLEGDHLNRMVLSNKSIPAVGAYHLSPGESGAPVVNAGTLHGVLQGTVFAVHDAETGKPAGHVKVIRADQLTSVVEPVAYNGLKKKDNLPARNRCQIVLRSYGDARLAVAILPAMPGHTPATAEELAELQRLLQAFAADNDEAYRVTDAGQKAGWRVAVSDGFAFLLSPEEQASGPYKLDGRVAEKLNAAALKIIRARTLIQVAGNPQANGSAGGTALTVHMNVQQAQGEITLQPEQLSRREGDVVRFVIRNPGRDPVDITLLHIDDKLKIECIVPGPAGPNNQLPAKGEMRTPRFRLSAGAGTEHLILIAVKTKPLAPRFNFSFLAQSAVRNAGPNRVAASPLGRYLAGRFFKPSTAPRGLTPSASTHQVTRLSWRTRAAQ